MEKTILMLSLAFAFGLCSGCFATDTKPSNDLGKDVSNSMKTLGKEADKAGQALRSSVKNLGSASKGGKNCKANNDWQKNASSAMTTLGNEADKVGRTISNAVKGVGKDNNTAQGNNNGKNGSGRSLNDSMNEFGKSASGHAEFHEEYRPTGRRTDRKEPETSYKEFPPSLRLLSFWRLILNLASQDARSIKDLALTFDKII